LDKDKTDIIVNSKKSESAEARVSPRLFVNFANTICEYRIEGEQYIGRPTDDYEPSIPIDSRFVSRQHGCFRTSGVVSNFTAMPSTNGIYYQGKLLEPDKTIRMKDGDELTIPTEGDGDEENSFILLVYASTPSRINMWRGFQKAGKDTLTGLSRRDSFISWWQGNQGRKDYRNAAIFLMDIDFFKRINDSLGHNAGDMVLKAVADTLKNNVRYENQLCRWGGDEFAGILPGDSEQAGQRLRKIISEIRELHFEGIPSVSVSLGYANVNDAEDRLNMEELVQMADRALYFVKRNGKQSICFYDPALLPLFLKK